jgi:hypothetical protein
MTPAVIAATSAVFVAILGAAAAYLNNKILLRRNERLRWLSGQLSELYGPLVTIGAANRIAFLEFERRYAPRGEGLFGRSTTDDIRRIWRIWVETVFMPNNRRMLEILQSKGHLLLEDEVPEVLLQFAAHTYGYEALLARWREGDFSDDLSVVDFPRDFEEYAQSRFRALKAQQLHLLRNDRIVALGGTGKDPDKWARYHEYGYWRERSDRAVSSPDE